MNWRCNTEHWWAQEVTPEAAVPFYRKLKHRRGDPGPGVPPGARCRWPDAFRGSQHQGVGTRPAHSAVPTFDLGQCSERGQQGLHQEALCQGQACVLGQSGMWPHSPISFVLGSGDQAEGSHNWWLHVEVLQGLLEAGQGWLPLPADHWQAQVQGRSPAAGA